jgi:hypothetical protein
MPSLPDSAWLVFSLDEETNNVWITVQCIPIIGPQSDRTGAILYNQDVPIVFSIYDIVFEMTILNAVDQTSFICLHWLRLEDRDAVAVFVPYDFL